MKSVRRRKGAGDVVSPVPRFILLIPQHENIDPPKWLLGQFQTQQKAESSLISNVDSYTNGWKLPCTSSLYHDFPCVHLTVLSAQVIRRIVYMGRITCPFCDLLTRTSGQRVILYVMKAEHPTTAIVRMPRIG